MIFLYEKIEYGHLSHNTRDGKGIFMKKKWIALLTAALLLAGCQTVPDKTASDSVGNDTEPHTETETETETPSVLEKIPQADYDDYTFHYLTESWTGTVADRFLRELQAEEVTGEPINDAVYARNQFLADRLHIRITAQDADNVSQSVLGSVRSGEDLYQLVGAYKFNTTSLLSQHAIRDWNALDIDFDADWWSREAVNKLSICGKQYFMSGSILMSEIDDTLAMAFNKDIQNEYKLDDVYTLVESGKWTVDAMKTMVEQVSNDLNGDGRLELGVDLLGYAQDSNSMTTNWAFSLDLLHGAVTEENTYEWNIDTDRIQTALEKVNAMMALANTDLGTDYYTGLDIFAEGKLYFYSIILSALEIVRDMEDDFGIAPYPKLEEAQAQYYNHVGNMSPILSLPITNTSDDERTAAILTALAISSYDYVRPVYFDSVLKGKLSRDPQTRVMLDIVQQSATYDLPYVLGPSLAGTVNGLMQKNSSDFASAWKSAEKSMTTSINKFLQSITEK